VNRHFERRIDRQARGFTLPAAIFLLVVLAVLGAAIVMVFTTQQVGSALDLQGSRVYQAARAGIEWGAYKIARGGASCTGATSFAFATAPTLSGITVTVTCTAYPDASGGPTVYEIDSTACNQPLAAEPKCPNTGAPGTTYVERRLKVKI
jgi:MSHA biogenesis protein MshP